MCRTTEYYDNPRDRLKITAFYVQLSLPSTCTFVTLPDSLTLLFLPRIDATLLEVNGSKIRPDSPAFLTLHRMVSHPAGTNVVFATREKVKASNGLLFEVYVGDHKLVKGVFRGVDDDYENDDYDYEGHLMWRVECKCVLEKEVPGVDINEVVVVVESAGKLRMKEKIAVVVEKGMRRRRRCRGFENGLEEIPEERERDLATGEDEDALVFDDCCCCCSCDENDDEGDDYYGVGRKDDVEMEMVEEGVKWAMDVGIWVMCLGVGLLVSRASAKRLRRKKLFA